MLKLAAGINKGGSYKGFEWVGVVNLKQVIIIRSTYVVPVISTKNLMMKSLVKIENLAKIGLKFPSDIRKTSKINPFC